MSLQDIFKKIAADAQNEIEQAQAEVKKQKLELDKASTQKEVEEKSVLESKTETALQSVDEKTASMARRENKQKGLNVKRKVLNTALSKLLEAIEGADDAVYTEINTKLIKALPFAEGTMIVPTRRLATMKKIASEFDLTTTDELKGGFIAAHEGQEVDNSFKNIIYSEYRSELEMHISHQLKLI